MKPRLHPILLFLLLASLATGIVLPERLGVAATSAVSILSDAAGDLPSAETSTDHASRWMISTSGQSYWLLKEQRQLRPAKFIGPLSVLLALPAGVQAARSLELWRDSDLEPTAHRNPPLRI